MGGGGLDKREKSVRKERREKIEHVECLFCDWLMTSFVGDLSPESWGNQLTVSSSPRANKQCAAGSENGYSPTV